MTSRIIRSAYGGAREAARLRAIHEQETRETERPFDYNERDGGLSTGHAIMRDGPQVRLSPGLGADGVPRRLRP